MKRLILILTIVIPSVLHAQRMATSFTDIEDILPEGWVCASNNGDMNKDGLEDMAVIFYPPEQQGNPILAVYWGTAKGSFHIWKQLPDVLPANDDYILREYSVEVTKKGVLKLSYGFMMTAGGWNNDRYTYLFRYDQQQDDFLLIGEEYSTMSRNTGEAMDVSTNYLTAKQKTMRYNGMSGKGKGKETWKNTPKEPLKHLTTWKLE